MSKRGENPYEFLPPSDFPVGVGKEHANIEAQNFFHNHIGFPKSFNEQLSYLSPILKEFCDDMQSIINLMKDIKSSSISPSVNDLSFTNVIQPGFIQIHTN